MPRLVLKLNGANPLKIAVGSPYEEPGAEAYYQRFFTNEELDVTITGNVDTNVIGDYTTTYDTKYKNIEKKLNRHIKVVDEEPPVIVVNKEIKGCKERQSVDIDANVIDNYDGDITSSLTYRIKGNDIYLQAEDSSQNRIEEKRAIIFMDDETPEITLNGSETMLVNLYDDYIELGATATQFCLGDITSQLVIEGNVDTSKEGQYEVNYILKQNGTEIKKTRHVIVKNNQEKIVYVTDGTIYLTFDDGPGQYTESFLQVLAKYDVKATFFVTGQFPKYQSLIKKEFEAGHTIGIHTYSHRWNVYESVESYLNDFNQIENIVYAETGTHPKIFRFPGGSNNTISKNYKKGIMSELAQIMTDKGYTYFDWTFDSGDTSRYKNSKQDIINTVKTYLKGNGKYIILMHDLKKNTLDALPEIIEYAKSRGYKFKTLDNTAQSPIVHFKIAN